MIDSSLDLAALRDRWDRWRTARGRFAVGPRGPLALEGTYWVTIEQQAFPGVPGRFSPPPRGAEGLLLDIEPELLADPALAADGAILLPVSGRPGSSPLALADGRLVTVIAAETASLDGGFAARVWNPAASSIAAFSHIDVFDYDPAWALAGRVEALEGQQLEVGHVRDGDRTRPQDIPAEVVVTIAGQERRLLTFHEPPGLLVVFADATTGKDTYSVGRFLMLQPEPDGSVIVDFNRAYLPPCAFSTGYNCPLPPFQNRLPVPVEAGEKVIRSRNGELQPPASVPGWCA